MVASPEADEEAPAALAGAYGALRQLVSELGDEDSWRPTDCAGWAARDVILHCLLDAQRGLIALHTPDEGSPDRDRVSYWRDWPADELGAAHGRRFTRVVSSMFLEFGGLREWYLETTGALLNAAATADAGTVVATQGHRLLVGDLLHTLAVEATIHHLDLLAGLPGAPLPSSLGLAATRRALDGLLGHRPKPRWDTARYIRVATGRATASTEELAALGADAARFPLFR